MLLGKGFEEIETVASLDVLRRAGIDVSTVALTDDLLVSGGHGITVKADITIGQLDFDSMEMLVLPGGGGGVKSISCAPAAMELINRTRQAEKPIAAICAAPSLLVETGILDGRKVVCHPSVNDVVCSAGALLQSDLTVVRDGSLITGKAAGYAIEFGLVLVAFLRGSETAEHLSKVVSP